MDELKPCPFCGKPLYIKIKRYAKPLLMPATHAAALRDELIDITGEDYAQIETKYCPMCGLPLDRRAAPENKPLTLEQLRKMKVPCPLYEEETPSGDITESRIEPVLFNGIHSGNEERACWITSEAHHANARTEHILAGKINFYARKPEGSEKT